MRLGLFEQPYVDEEHARAVLSDPAHRETARAAARRSAVLLRNEGQMLPLDPSTLYSVAVIGAAAATPRTNGGGSAAVIAPATVSPLDALAAALPATTARATD